MKSLAQSDIATTYARDGFAFPIQVMEAREAAEIRATLETLEATYNGGAGAESLPRPLNNYLRVNAHVVLPFAARVAYRPEILDAVSAILGDDLLAWSCEFFIKEPKSTKIVSWHQDLTYWGMGETDDQVTAWIAISDVTAASGCMRFVPGSHNQRIVPHRDTFSADNLLSRGQEIAVDVDEADAVDIVLAPGQISLHHGRMFHASGPNTSDDRRIGMAIRYVTPGVRQEVADRDYAMLVRGVDRGHNWLHVAPPTENFSPQSLRVYDEIRDAQKAALAQGAAGDVALYA